MKIKNEYVKIKLGKKEHTFTNLILDNYIDLYADSFLNFKNKALSSCFIKFDIPQFVDINSKTMEYDLVLNSNFSNTIEIYTENMITNNYTFNEKVSGFPDITDFKGHRIVGLGFGTYEYSKTKEKNIANIYAYLDVSNYNIYIQDEQNLIISRKDKITTDLEFYSDFEDVKYPTHLTTRGTLEVNGNEYNTIYSQLYSIGLGTLKHIPEKEITVDNFDIIRDGVGIVRIRNAKDYAIYPSSTVYPSAEIYPRKKYKRFRKIKNR